MEKHSRETSADSLQKLVKTFRFGVFLLDKNWCFTYINRVGEQQIGKKKKNLLGKNFWQVFPKFKKTELETKFKKVVSSGVKQKVTLNLDQLDRVFSIWVYKMPDGVGVVFDEVTRRRRLRRGMEFSLDLFEGLFEHAPIGFAILDSSLRFLKVNRVFMSLGVISQAEYYGKSIRQVFPQLSGDAFTKLRQVLKTKEPILNFEFSWPSPVNPLEIKDFIISYYPITHPQTEVMYVGLLIRDISERKRVDRKLALTQLNLSYLLEATEILSTSLNYTKTLKSLAELVVPQLADWCAIEMLTKDNQIELVTVAHQDKQKARWARKFRSKYPPVITNESGIGYVISTGKPELIPLLPPTAYDHPNMTKRERILIKKIGFHSIMTVPIKVENKVVGLITFVSAESKRVFDQDDLEIAQELANRASLFIENAKLYGQVRAERQRLNDLLANVPGVVWEAWGNPSGKKQKIDFVSRYVEDMLGYTQEEWLKKPNFWLTIVHPDDRKRAAEEAKKIYLSGAVGISQFRWVKKDGSSIWVEAQSQVITDAKGQPVGMRGVTMDITDHKEQEARKDEFISMASHELKTPLTTEKLLIQLLERKVNNSNDSSYLSHVQKIGAQIDRMTRLVDDLLDVSRINVNRMQLNFEQFNLDASIRELVSEIQQTTRTHTIKIEGHIKHSIVGDQDRILQVATNLLTNAIKYSPMADTIVVRLSETQKEVSLSVQDFGIGVPRKDFIKIFDRFYRAHTKEAKSISGMGVGLYISAEIVKRHGGSISVESQPHKGSTFTVILPIRAKTT